MHRDRDLEAARRRVELGAEEVGDGRSALRSSWRAARVAHPAVDTTAAGVDPQQVLEAKILGERGEHAERQGHERPAAIARRRAVFTSAVEEVVVGQVDIDDELALQRLGRA